MQRCQRPALPFNAIKYKRTESVRISIMMTRMETATGNAAFHLLLTVTENPRNMEFLMQ